MANDLDNIPTLCLSCHRLKTEREQRVKNRLESRMLGNLHVRFGFGAGVKLPGLHHPPLGVAPSCLEPAAVLVLARTYRGPPLLMPAQIPCARRSDTPTRLEPVTGCTGTGKARYQ